MTVDLLLGDCLEVMAEMPENSVDSIITDPPYDLSFMGKDWDRFSGGFSQKEDWKEGNLGGLPRQRRRNIKCPDCGRWIYTDPDRACRCGGVRRAQMRAFEEFSYRWARAVLRVAKPGAMLMAFGGTRTHHRLMVAIEDAGWVLRDTIMWVYGSGFPKSHDISKAIDKAAGAEREVIKGGGRSNIGTGARSNGESIYSQVLVDPSNPRTTKCDTTIPATDLARTWDGWGTNLKPAWEPVIVAMAPLDGTFAQNAQKWGVAGLWIDGCRVPANDNVTRDRDTSDGASIFGTGKGGGAVVPVASGRFPANLIHDGSDEVVGGFPVTSSGLMRPNTERHSRSMYGQGNGAPTERGTFGDSGSAARFFYCAKASRRERNAGCEGMEKSTKVWNGQGPHSSKEMKPLEQRWTTTMRNNHPTVKPLALMEYLCKLTRTPTGGVVLDPFMGSGTTGIACVNTDRDFIGIEIDPTYFAIAEKRIAEARAAQPLPEERHR